MFYLNRFASPFLVLCFASVLGCAQVKVGVDSVIKKIDNMLGEMDVQKAQIELALSAAKMGAQEVMKARIRGQVQYEQVSEKVKPYEERMTQIDEGLIKLRDSIKTDKAAVFGGKSYTVEEQKKLAEELIDSREKAESEISSGKSSRDSMKKMVDNLVLQENKYKSKIQSLESEMSRMDTEIEAAKALKAASASMGDSNATLDENLKELEKKITNLKTNVKIVLTTEDGKWDSKKADTAISDSEEFLKASKKSTNTLDRIDKALGKSK